MFNYEVVETCVTMCRRR